MVIVIDSRVKMNTNNDGLLFGGQSRLLLWLLSSGHLLSEVSKKIIELCVRERAQDVCGCVCALFM